MPKIKRQRAVKLMEALGFDTAGALSTSRLQKKLNRLDKVIEDDVSTGDDQMDDLPDVIFDAFDTGEPVVVVEDRENIPAPKKQAVKRFDSGGGGGSSKSKYDWDSILDGKINVMEQGSDYDCKSNAFAMQARTAAKRRGLKVKIKVEQGRVILQSRKEE